MSESAESLVESVAQVAVGAEWAVTGVQQVGDVVHLRLEPAVNPPTAIMHTRTAVLPFHATAALREARRRREAIEEGR